MALSVKEREAARQRREKEATVALLKQITEAVENTASTDAIGTAIRSINDTIKQIKLPETDLSDVSKHMQALVRTLDDKFESINLHLLDLQRAEWEVDVSRDKKNNISKLHYKRVS